MSIQQQITDAIIAELQTGVAPWNKPWLSAQPSLPLRHNGEPYRGVNVLHLWMQSMLKGHTSPYWMTFNQMAQFGARLIKGSKATPVVYMERKTREDEDGELKSWTLMKTYLVFNASQMTNLPPRFQPKPAEGGAARSGAIEEWPEAETFFSALPLVVKHGGSRACFIPSQGVVLLPERVDFKTSAAYYSTRAHESIHWTADACQRDLRLSKFGDERYAMEELVAEIGAAFTMAHLGHQPQVREDHAPYIANWINVLKDDPKAIVLAASQASKALDVLLSYQPQLAREVA